MSPLGYELFFHSQSLRGITEEVNTKLMSSQKSVCEHSILHGAAYLQEISDWKWTQILQPPEGRNLSSFLSFLLTDF